MTTTQTAMVHADEAYDHAIRALQRLPEECRTTCTLNELRMAFLAGASHEYGRHAGKEEV